MDPIELTTRLEAFEQRGPGTDAERRASRFLRGVLRSSGRRALVEPLWVRPHWALSLALHAMLGVAASLAAVSVPAVGLGVALALAVSLGLESTGRGRLLGLVTTRRATQNVYSPPPREAAPGQVTVVLTATCSAFRRGMLFNGATRARGARLQRLLGWRAPGARAWPVIALGLVVVTAAWRLAGGSGETLGLVQLVPTVILLVTVALALDIATSRFSPAASADGTAVAAVLAAAEALEARPLRNVVVSVLLAGAGEEGAQGLRGHLRRMRYVPAETVVLEVTACGHGRARFLQRHGVMFAGRAHEQLVAAASAAGGEGHVAHRLTGAGVARVRRLPAVSIGAYSDVGHQPRAREADDVAADVDVEAIRSVGRLVVGTVRALDRALAGTEAERRDAAVARGAREQERSGRRGRRGRRGAAAQDGGGGRAAGAAPEDPAGAAPWRSREGEDAAPRDKRRLWRARSGGGDPRPRGWSRGAGASGEAADPATDAPDDAHDAGETARRARRLGRRG